MKPIMKITRYLSRNLLHNYKIKVFSLLSALFLWFYVVIGNEVTYTLNVPLKLINKPDDWILMQDIPKRVRVSFKFGSGMDLLDFAYGDNSILLDVQQIRRIITFPISLDDVLKIIPSGKDVTPLEIVEPETVKVQLDRFARKRVVVESAVSLEPLEGYILVGSIKFEPDTIEISGPSSLVKEITKVSTSSEEYHNLIKEIQRKIDLIPPEWTRVNYSENKVQFTADFQRIGERTITGVPVRVINVPAGIKVSANPLTLALKLTGGVKMLSRLDPEDIKVTIDYSKRFRYSGRLPAIVKPPEGIIEFSDVNPQYFEIHKE